MSIQSEDPKRQPAVPSRTTGKFSYEFRQAGDGCALSNGECIGAVLDDLEYLVEAWNPGI